MHYVAIVSAVLGLYLLDLGAKKLWGAAASNVIVGTALLIVSLGMLHRQ